MDNLEASIRKYLSRITGEPFLEDGIPDLFKDDPSKAYMIYIFKLLDLLADEIKKLVKQHGADAVTKSLYAAALGQKNALADQLMRDHFEELLPGQEELFGTLNYDEYIRDPSVGMWERVLLLIGVSPKYADIMERYFGDFGLVSLASFIKALATGEIDFSIVMQEFTLPEDTNESTRLARLSSEKSDHSTES